EPATLTTDGLTQRHGCLLGKEYGNARPRFALRLRGGFQLGGELLEIPARPPRREVGVPAAAGRPHRLPSADTAATAPALRPFPARRPRLSGEGAAAPARRRFGQEPI